MSKFKLPLLAFLCSCLVFAAKTSMGQEPYEGKIVYVREDIPSIPVKPFKGKTYQDRIPDTLDIATRADLAINALTRAVNPNADYEQYFAVYFNTNPPIMQHSVSDVCGLKFMEALPLLRIITGSTLNDKVDRVWQEVTLKSIGPDGLYYLPLEGRPWFRQEIWTKYVARADGSVTSIDDPTVTQFTNPLVWGRMLGTMTVYYLRDKNPIWKKINEQMIDRLIELAIHKDDYSYFPSYLFEPNAKFDLNRPEAAAPQGIGAGETTGRVIQGLAQFYKVTGYEPARELAGKVSRFMRHHAGYFNEAGEFISEEKYFHAHTIVLLSMLEHALAAGDKELMEFVRRSYEWAKSPEASSSSLIGFFPMATKADEVSCEGCNIADMIALALKLTEGGAGDYYEDAERWTRNQFAEAQLTQTDWVYRVAGQQPKLSEVPEYATADRVPERNIGAFASWSAANQFWNEGIGISHCCTGNAARSIYYIWQHILDYKAGQLRLNMLLNRASPWVDVHSYIPYEGQVDLKVKKTCSRVLVHAPQWIDTGSDQIAATVNGKARALSWEGRYIHLGEVKNGQTVIVKFPIAERTVKETIGNLKYTLVLKGNSLVHIDPPGKKGPLYLRDHYRENQVRWRKVKRFVSHEQVEY